MLLWTMLYCVDLCSTHRQKKIIESAGVEILKGLGTGLDNQYWKNKIFGKVSGLMGNIMGTLGIITGNKSLKLPGHENGLDYVPYDNYIARLHKGERVLTAEERLKRQHSLH